MRAAARSEVQPTQKGQWSIFTLSSTIQRVAAVPILPAPNCFRSQFFHRSALAGSITTLKPLAMTAPASSHKKCHRFADIQTAPPDAILGLTEAFLADKNPDKMNLSVGVYKDASCQTPVLGCVKAAEHRLLETERTKGYLPIDGLPDYRESGTKADLWRRGRRRSGGGSAVAWEPVTCVIAAGFLASQLIIFFFLFSNRFGFGCPRQPGRTINAVFSSEGLPIELYRYLAADRTSFDFEATIEDLGERRPRFWVTRSSCTGAATTRPAAIRRRQWREIAKNVAERGCSRSSILPTRDLPTDSGKTRRDCGIRRRCPKMIVCSSFSKNFGLYRERAAQCHWSRRTTQATAQAVRQSQLKRVVRCNYSNPPRHGAVIVATVLADQDLTQTMARRIDGNASTDQAFLPSVRRNHEDRRGRP